MDHKLSYKLYWISLIVSLLVMVFSLAFQVLWLGILGVCIAFIGAIQAGFFWRCPRCGHNLPFRNKRPDYCPYCAYDLGFADSEEL